MHLPCGQAHGFGITATVVTPLMPRICLDISNGLRFGELCRTIRCRRSELDGTVGDRVSLHTSSLMRFTSSRVGESSLLRRSIIMSARGVSTRLNPVTLPLGLGQAISGLRLGRVLCPYTRPFHEKPSPKTPLTVESIPIPE